MGANLGLDDEYNAANNLTGSATGWADKVMDLLRKGFKQSDNPFGTAATKNTGTAVGNVVVVGSNGKIASSLYDAGSTGMDISGLSGTITSLSSSDYLAASDESASGDPTRKFLLSTLRSWLESNLGLAASRITSGTLAAERLAAGGSTGQVLTRTSTGQSWQAAGGSSFKISDLTEHAGIVGGDYLAASDESVSGDPNRKLTVNALKAWLEPTLRMSTSVINSGVFSTARLGNNAAAGKFLKAVSGTAHHWASLPTILSNPSIDRLASLDQFPVYDSSAGTDKKVSIVTLRNWIVENTRIVFLNILSSVSTTDYMRIYDASAQTEKRVVLSTLRTFMNAGALAASNDAVGAYALIHVHAGGKWRGGIKRKGASLRLATGLDGHEDEALPGTWRNMGGAVKQGQTTLAQRVA